jgi:hypothetical protein
MRHAWICLLPLLLGIAADAEEEAIVPLRERVGKILEEGARAEAGRTGNPEEDRRGELWHENGPETLFVHSQSRSRTESIERDWLSGRAPLPGKWRMAAVAERSFFCINERNSPVRREADLTRIELRGEWVRDPKLRVWMGGELHQGSAEGGGPEAGIVWSPVAKVETRISAWAGRAWDESTDAVRQDGIRHGGDALLTWKPWDRLAVALDGAAGAYSAEGQGSLEDRFAGRRFEGGVRVDAAIWKPGSLLGAGFLDRTASADEGLESGVFLFGSARRQVHEMPHAFTAVAVIEESEERTLGGEWRQPLGRRFGAVAGVFVGQDQERDISWPELYGMQARLLAFPGGHARLWAGWELASDSGTATGGRTATVEWGLNLEF